MSDKVISIILAAGASTRMKSRRSKLLHQVLGKTIVERACDIAASINPQKIIVVLGHQRELIEPSLREISLKTPLQFVHQKEQKGTADAVKVALSALKPEELKGAHLFIMPADAVLLRTESLQGFLFEHLSSKARMSLITARMDEPGALGRILRDQAGAVLKIVEFKDSNPQTLQINEINSGFYLIQYSALEELLSKIDSTNKSGEFYLTDLVELIRKQDGLVKALEIKDPFEAFGINNQIELSIVSKVLQRRTNYLWMLKGIQMVDAEATWIDSRVELESDIVIHPGTILKGKTRVGYGAELGPYAVIENCKIGKLSRIKAHSHLEGAEVGEACVVGPFARLRPGSKLDQDVRVGNFVEIKNSHLEKGVKAGHLTYLGDSTIGEDSNIGAGTITCNYNGFEKFKTKLGKNVFIGSNASLVAPVTIGDGAIVGAGSVISGEAQADSLVVERSEQREIKGGAKRYRNKYQEK